jgi:hypothetical protein
MSPSTQITPFWHRLRAISLYPLQQGALWSLIALTLGRGIAWILPFSWLLNAILSAGVYTFAVAILRRTASGRMDPPEVTLDGESSGWSQLWLQLAFWALLMVSILVSAAFESLVPVVVTAIVLALSLPAATLSLAMDDNFGHALNPATWWAIASRLGWPYLAMAGLAGVILFSQANAQEMLLWALPEPLAVIAGYFVATYAVYMYFHLLGYVIYQYHEELGHEVETPAIALRNPNADPDQDVLDEAAERVLAGDSLGAETLLARRLQARGGTAAVHNQYRKLLRVRGDTATLLQHGREYLNVLMAQGQEKLALDLAKDCLAIDEDWAPLQAEHVQPLARRAAELGQAKVAVQLTEAFAEYHPGHGDVAANALVAAKMLAEKLGDERRALVVLRTARASLGPHAEVDAYLQLLEKLAAPTAKA